MNSEPLVSIIMAARDTEPYIETCLDSIVDQSYTNWELIAVNDHSTDQTPLILEHYAAKDNRIKVVHSKRHKLIPALKEGYQHVKGELLNRMDSDDRMPHDKLEVMVKAWLPLGKGNIVAGGTEHFVENGEVGGGFLRYDRWLNNVARNNLHWREIYRECVIPSHCWLIHRDDFESAGGFEPEVYPEDYDLCFRLYEQGFKVLGMDKVLHYWRDRSERISRTWEEYQDNRYYDLKARYFFKLDRDESRPLVLWGAGRNGKDLAKVLKTYISSFHWVCDNERKIGKEINGIEMASFESIPTLHNPQIIIAVAGPDDQESIHTQLQGWGFKRGVDYWFF